mmetsp:Transcript_2352/g.3774  ORF Transcript_2352/g.3774 Transcript_2352/m.3774 type:complete len:186 (+) Transcript_2352:444-1001(+)
MGGFMNISDKNLRPHEDDPYCISAVKPGWAAGEKAAISLPAPPAGAPAATWTLALDDDAAGGAGAGGDDDGLVDEDALLDATPAPPAAGAPGAGCGPGAAPGADGAPKKRRACKNCSCGLKEMEEAEAAGGPPVKIDPLEKASACGSCSKGDAFRCATCPFLGKPAFRPGEEALVLNLDDTNEQI